MFNFSSSGFIGVGSLAIILILGFYFNWPSDVQTNALSQIAPEFAQIQNYINTPPISLASQHGHVVLLHFWRLGCENCQADIPFINQMYTKYHNYGLKVISIHTPQFDNERVLANVQASVTVNNIKYPVLIDNEKSTFYLYGDSGWPKDVIVSKNGYITYTHLGSGDNYNRETAIRTELTVSR